MATVGLNYVLFLTLIGDVAYTMDQDQTDPSFTVIHDDCWTELCSVLNPDRRHLADIVNNIGEDNMSRDM